MAHFKHLEQTFPNLNVIIMELTTHSQARFFVCLRWCRKRFCRELQGNIIPKCPSMIPLRPFSMIPDALKFVTSLHCGAWSLLDLSLQLGGSLERGYYMNLEGDVKTDEDLAGTHGTLCGRIEWTEEEKLLVMQGIAALIQDGEHNLVKSHILVGEKTTYDLGTPLLSPEILHRSDPESRGIQDVETGIASYTIPRQEEIRRAQLRARGQSRIRAGVLYDRETGRPKPVFWNSDIEVLVFPYLYLNGYGGYLWTSEKGIVWEEHVEKRIWSVNPLFRCCRLFLSFIFDVGEKIELHRSSTRSFVPDYIDEEDADQFLLMSQNSCNSYERKTRRELIRGRWGIAAASCSIGKPNIFQTETMNESDMEELCKVACRLRPEDELCIDDVSTSYLYKMRQIAIVEDLLPMTGMKEVVYAGIRLEIQSGRSYKLQNHNMLLVGTSDDELLKCISASLSSLEPTFRKKHAPVSRHRCLPQKCKNGECLYGYPVLTPAERTHRIQEEVETIVYKRQVGSDGTEKDEYVTPFFIELASVRTCHGAFLICTDEVAIGYTGKYTFKSCGALGSNPGSVSLADVMKAEEVQLLKNDRDSSRRQLLKERIGTRNISMMELCLSLCGEGLVYSTFYLRELWIVLPNEKKKFVDGSIIRKGVPGGSQLQNYYRRPVQFENDSFEKYYSRACVRHGNDHSRGVQLLVTMADYDDSQIPLVLVNGSRKRLIARIMPIRGREKRLIDKCCWGLILRKVPHRSVSSVWDFLHEHSWDAAARSGALGSDKLTLRGLPALEAAIDLSKSIEMEFSTKMGRTESEKEMEKGYFEDAFNAMIQNYYGSHQEQVLPPLELGRSENANVTNSAVATSASVVVLPRNDLQLEFTGSSLPPDIIMWRRRFELKGWVLNPRIGTQDNENSRCPEGQAILSVPENVKDVLRKMKDYPSQLATCLEVLDTIVRGPRGLRRFIAGSAGKGKSYVKKSLAKILRSVELNVQVLAVAAIVAQDDEGGTGATIASAFNYFLSNAQKFDERAYELSKVDVFIIDEISMVSVRQARIMTNYFARGEYLRTGGLELYIDERISRHFFGRTKELKSTRGFTNDPWFGVNIIAVGDLLQLGPPDADPLYSSERLWKDQFRSNTLLLEENVRWTDVNLSELADMARVSYENTAQSRNHRLVQYVRNRTVSSMNEVPLDCTVLSPRFHRAIKFANECLLTATLRDSERKMLGWGEEVHSIKCEDYVTGHKVALEHCIGMDVEERLEVKRTILDKDHSRLREFSFRAGMIAVITENGTLKEGSGTFSISKEPKWPGMEQSRRQSGIGDTSQSRRRLLNGERVKILGVAKARGTLTGVKVAAADGQWIGERLIKRTASKSDMGRNRNSTEGKTVRFLKSGIEKVGRITRLQVPLILELALTVHKAQGMTLSRVVVDLGCEKGSYAGGLLYTAITRVKSFECLWFIGTSDNDRDLLQAFK